MTQLIKKEGRARRGRKYTVVLLKVRSQPYPRTVSVSIFFTRCRMEGPMAAKRLGDMPYYDEQAQRKNNVQNQM